MGNLEKEVAERARKARIQKAILQTAAAAGLLSIALLAPNALQVFGGRRKKNPKYSIQTSVGRLLERGCIEMINTGRGKMISVTKKGEAYLRELERRDFTIEKPKRWDEKWRVVIFDIRENRRNTRALLRSSLQQVGFMRLQDSVWVYPYDCEDFITLLKADFKIGKDVLYMISEKIEYDRPLREHFGLGS